MKKRKKKFSGIREMCPVCCFQVRIDTKTDQYVAHDTSGCYLRPGVDYSNQCTGSGITRISATYVSEINTQNAIIGI